MKNNRFITITLLSLLTFVAIFHSCRDENEVFIVLNKTGQNSVEQGDTLYLTADVQVLGKQQIDKTIHWKTTNPKVATIDDKGMFIALDTGLTEIKASLSNGKYAVTEIKITQRQAKSVILSSEKMYLQAFGADTMVTAIIKPTKMLEDFDIKWTVENTEIAKIISSKKDTLYLRPLKKGKTTLTLKIGGTTKTCEINVLSAIRLQEKDKYLQVNGRAVEISASLSSQIIPSNAVIKWHSADETVLKVNLIRQQSGKSIATIKPLSEGDTKLIAQYEDYADTCIVHVGAMVDLSWDKSNILSLKSITMYLNETLELPVYATITPDLDTYINAVTYDWANDNENIVSISSTAKDPNNKRSSICTLQSGAVEGTSNITVTARGTTISAIITIKDKNKIDVESITLDKTTATVDKGNYIVLNANVLPIGVVATWPIQWSSDNKSVATVDNTGKVTGIESGKATITARIKDKMTTCEITVVETVNSIIIETDSRNVLMLGDSEKWVATINPSSAGNVFETIWKSSNKTIATIDTNGNITAKGTGTAIITASASDKSVTREVTIINAKNNVNFGETFDNGGYTVNNKTLQLKVEDGDEIYDFTLNFNEDITALTPKIYTMEQELLSGTIKWNGTPQVTANISTGTLEIQNGNNSYSRKFIFNMTVALNNKTIEIRGEGVLEEL